ncbi:MAG: class I mannose-6-phosphate isomerase [Acidobacteriales bacterium]|nr:class I mannose-6-phosphate isomerase [Terriglobales bacterium]
MDSAAVRLVPRAVPKVWGVTKLEPWHRDAEERIGEIWLLHPKGAQLPLLVKFLYTSEALSVQVHPDDDYARQHENSCGKTEMWVILRAEPGARIAHGLREPVSRERLREAALSGEIESLLNWVPVAAGDVLFTPAGVIHAVGAGIALCEIQQTSDVTYRLYDYGRPRDLHVEKAIDVSHLQPGPPRIEPAAVAGDRELLVHCGYFAVERLRVAAEGRCELAGGLILIVLDGIGSLDGTSFRPGDAWLIPADQVSQVRAESACALLAARF